MKLLIITLGILLMVTNSIMLHSQNPKNNYLKDKHFLGANIKSRKNMDPRIKPLSHPDIFWIDKMELFGIYSTLAKDPIPAPNPFILLPDSSIYHVTEILDVLKKLELFPTSDEEAIKHAALIIYCLNKDDHILTKNGSLFGEYEPHIEHRNKLSIGNLSTTSLSQIENPKSERKDNYYIIKLYVNNFESHEYWKPKLSSFYKLSIKIGKEIFEIIEKDEIGTSFFEL